MSALTNEPPAHVDRALVFDVDPGSNDDMITAPFDTWRKLKDLPPLFWSSASNQYSPAGCWIATGADVVRDVMQRPEVFSNERGAGGGFGGLTLVPLFLDPPEHIKYRALLGPVFSPKNIDAVERSLDDLCKELIDGFADKTGCEFMSAFARPFPVIVFMRMMGLPMARRDEFVDLEHKIFQGKTMEERATAFGAIISALRDLIEERRKDPRDDIVSRVAAAQIDGKPITQEMAEGMCLLLFMAGLDTVAAGLGHTFRYLAEHPEMQARLRADPALIPDAVEEMLRWHSWIPTQRYLVADIDDFHGVRMRKGDWVQAINYNASMDKGENARADEFLVPREPNRHFAFGAGVHRCAGSHLARRELRIAVRMILERIGEFSIAPGTELRYDGGLVCLGALPLKWDVTAPTQI